MDATRSFLEQGVGEPVHWMRALILQACRRQNLYALRELISRGATPGAKGTLGYGALEFCRMTRDAKLVV